MVKKSNKPKLTKEQIAENKKRKDFSNQIEKIFVNSGFEKLNVKNWQFMLGGKNNELDHCFIYENVLIVCEDTLKFLKGEEKNNPGGQINRTKHKSEKEETARIILDDEKKEFYSLLSQHCPESKYLPKYEYQEIKMFYLYFEYGVTKYSNEDIERYSHLSFIDKSTFSYFSIMSNSIKRSFIYELFKYFNLNRNDVGKPNPFGGGNIQNLQTSIIYPKTITGYTNGVRMVSFMMRPIDLIQNSYVLRKDGWKQDFDMYQRLVTAKRIKSVREYVANCKTAFLNNIIVTLPDSVVFFKKEGEETKMVPLESIVQFDKDIIMQIPLDYNSIGIIDGQHRVYAYYEDDSANETEQKIAKLREELNLLVTGIIYPKTGPLKEQFARRRFESEIFVTINKNAKAVDADTLIQVQAIMNPTSGEAISRKVIELLNNRDTFKNMFQLSKTDDAPIKTASIIQYALSSLLVAKNAPTSLYMYWLKKTGHSDDYVLEKDCDIKEYVNYCALSLETYFKAIKSRFLSYWNKESKLLKVISLNAFIIAFRETLLHTNGPRDYTFYFNAFSSFTLDFGKDNNNFPYAGAQYSKFAKALLIPEIEKYNRKVSI